MPIALRAELRGAELSDHGSDNSGSCKSAGRSMSITRQAPGGVRTNSPGEETVALRYRRPAGGVAGLHSLSGLAVEATVHTARICAKVAYLEKG